MKLEANRVSVELDLYACCNTFFFGANLGGSKITKSHDSFLERAPFINSVASSLKKDILPGSRLLRIIFSLASSRAGNDVSTPERKKKTIIKKKERKTFFKIHQSFIL